MKICHVNFSFENGGLENLIIDISNLQCRNNEVSILILNNIIDSGLRSKISPDVAFINCKRTRGDFGIGLFRFTMYCIRNRSQIYHVHNPRLIILLKLLFVKNVFLTVHDSGVVIKFPQLFRSIISISESVRNDLINRQAIASTVVLNGVDINLFRRKRKLKESSFENFKIVQVSRLRHTKKGQHLLLFAIKILRQLGLKNISVDFIGEGPSLYLLKELVSELGIESQVNFLGLQSREFIADHLCDYDLLIQPSFYEGFGLTIVEAFSARVPVLVSNIEGPNEIINNGEFGFSFESGDVDDLVAKIQYIHSNIDLASFKSDLAYNTRLSDFDINTTAQKYLSIYNYA